MKSACIPCDHKLDDLVASHLEDRLLQPERLEQILATVLDRRQERSERQHEHIGELNRRAAESEARLKRLYDAIEAGVADLNDPALKDRIDGLKAIRDQAKADAERAQAMLENSGSKAVTSQMVRTFAEPRGGISALKGVVIAATIFARSPSAWRSQMARSGSWDRSPGCYWC